MVVLFSSRGMSNLTGKDLLRSQCVVSLSKTFYPLLSYGSTQEDPIRRDRKSIDWDVENQTKQSNLCVSATFQIKK